MLTLRPGPACISVDVSAVADAHRSDKTNPTRNASAQTFLRKRTQRGRSDRAGVHSANSQNKATAKRYFLAQVALVF